MNDVERAFVIVKSVRLVPCVAACSKCQLKFFAPTDYLADAIQAEVYLRHKFDMHYCDGEMRLREMRRW